MKGTASQGKGARTTVHTYCRRCGSRSYHKRSAICASCGFGNSSRIRSSHSRKAMQN